MEKFEELQSIWNQQSDSVPKLNSNEIIAEANQNIKSIRAQHFWTIGILSATVIVLLYYFFWINNDSIAEQIMGLKLMIFVLIVRILVEIVSIIHFKKLDFMTNFKNHTQQLLSFYKLRKVIHFILTPIIYFTYCFGFITLLPLFKANLSAGFYLYILISGISFLIVFSYFLITAIKQDLSNLNFLKNV